VNHLDLGNAEGGKQTGVPSPLELQHFTVLLPLHWRKALISLVDIFFLALQAL
jgi:hypothetical protein